MSDYRTIYRDHALEYDALVRAEDKDGNLLKHLFRAGPLRGAHVVEVGAGTGRITRQLLGAGVAHVTATELEPAMLEVARQALASAGQRVRFEVADARALPLPDQCADLSVAGWVFGHFRSWMQDSWQNEVGKAVNEMLRVTRPGGRVMIVETLGTGSTEPSPPSPGLSEYYALLEDTYGFERSAFRTDYAFDSIEQAAQVTGAFFGPDFAARVRVEGWSTVPECTGLWVRAVGA